ncbi:MAG TPA: hypothetical protein PK402_03930, partial [Tepidisphaeraceae bacterium]|nr:hypothetical protein [Tepidisphaeraceae bacterium]
SAPTDIADALLELARNKLRLNQLDGASKLIDEAESISPDHTGLRELKIELRDARQKTTTSMTN